MVDKKMEGLKQITSVFRLMALIRFISRDQAVCQVSVD